MLRRHSLLLVLAATCLILAPGAGAEEPNTFTATSTPSHVKPSTSALYTIKLTNDASSGKEADRATITIPADFAVDESTVEGSTAAAESCAASAWVAEVSAATITLSRAGGMTNDRLCPGATLTVQFSATSAALEGSYTWVTALLRGEEAFTLSGSQPAVQVDGTPPTVTIEQKPSLLSNSRSATFTFTANAPAECKLDNADFLPCPPASYSDLADGEHTFTVRATDEAGNTQADSHVWTVDATAPDTTIKAGPPSETGKTDATFSFVSNEMGSTFQCRLDDEAFTACESSDSQTYEGLPEGVRTFAVRATDKAGNPDPTPATRSWTIDLNGPPTTISSGPPSITNSTSASFTFASEGGATFECSLDGDLFSTCPSPKSYDNLSPGPHVFEVRAIDSAGNRGSAASYPWTIDARAPVATVSGPVPLSNSRSATFAFSADEPSSFTCQLDGGALQPCRSPTSYEGLADGAHTFVVKATDAAGNIGNPVSYSWMIDAIAPETRLSSGPRSGTTRTSATFTFTANEPATFECRLDGAAFAPCTSPKSYARLRKIRHTFEVRALDPAGNVDATPAAHRWAVAAAPRTVKKTSALLTPEAGARVKTPPRLVWRRVAGARYYNVQLYRGRVKVLSAWPARPRLQLRARWTYLGRQRTLSPGRYRWYVWPAYGRDRYGRLLGESTFVVIRR